MNLNDRSAAADRPSFLCKDRAPRRIIPSEKSVPVRLLGERNAAILGFSVRGIDDLVQLMQGMQLC